MRHQVPFIGERKLVRADDEVARTKRISGRVIDDVVGDTGESSSWEDVVTDNWVDRSVPPVFKPAPNASISRSPRLPRLKVPIRSGAIAPTVNKSSDPALVVGSNTALRKGSVTLPGSSAIDWVLIRNGRGVRVNIHGAIGNHLRKEWARLLEGTEELDIEEFEFNLSDSPAVSLTGLAMLLLFKDKKRSVCKAFSLCNCTKEVTQLLEWTGMSRYFAIKTTHISEEA